MRARSRLTVALVIATGLAAGAGPALASKSREKNVESIELLVVKSTAAVRAVVTVRDYDRRKLNLDQSLEVIDVIKGANLPDRFNVLDPFGKFLRTPTAGRHEFLVLLREPRMGERPGRYVLAAIPLDRRHKQLRSMDLNVLRTPSQILAAAKAAAAEQPPPFWMSKRFRIPLDAYTPTGRRVIVAIPLIDRARRLALLWATSTDPEMRKAAANVLAKFLHPSSEAALKAMLADPHLETRQFTDHARQVYGVRLAAAAALARLNADFDQPAVESPPWPITFARRHTAGVLTLAALPLVPPIAYVLLRRHRRRRGLFVERLAARRLAFAALALASTVLLASLASACWDGRAQGRMFVRIRPDATAWAARTHAGKLQLLCITQRPPVLPTADWGPADVDLEATFTAPNAAIHSRRWGFLHATANYRGDHATMLQLPFWAAFALASILPLLWLRNQRHYARRRWRAAHAHCVDCGYDLRHAPARCPECGKEILEPPHRPTLPQS
jgi:hypothetical protein